MDKRLRVNRRSALIAVAMAGWPLAGQLETGGSQMPADNVLTAALQSLVDDPAQPLTCVSVQCVRAGRSVYQAHVGQRIVGDASSAAKPVTRDTLFRMASVSKVFVALGVMRLVEAGKLDLDADVGNALGYPLRHPAFPQMPITVRMLLSHRASLSDEGGYRFPPDVALSRVLAPGGTHFDGGRSWIAHQPGTYFQYCNFNYGVIASAMERASGQRFDRLMQLEVLGPLGIAGSFDPGQLSDSDFSNLATLYRKRTADPGEIWDTSGPWIAQVDAFRVRPAPIQVPDTYVLGSNGTLFGPQGSLRTRVQDLATVMTMLSAGGVSNGRRFLSPSSIEKLLTEQWRLDTAGGNGDSAAGLIQAWGLGLQHFIDRSSPEQSAGYGDRLLRAGGVKAWGHLGEAYGLCSGMLLDPERQCGVVYAIGGTGADPEKHNAQYSSLTPWEERLLDLAWQRLL
jgi:CubicO group peptidase (beta-lactamase class C family)